VKTEIYPTFGGGGAVVLRLYQGAPANTFWAIDNTSELFQ
jgi:hypothetical protein